ncbi:antirepressor [Escherichia coli]|nr:antirepressor [Escherichia coli]
MNMMAVPFHGNSLYVVNHNGEPYVPMKPVVAGMGLAWQSQLAKLRQRFASTITEIVMVAEDGKTTQYGVHATSKTCRLATNH